MSNLPFVRIAILSAFVYHLVNGHASETAASLALLCVMQTLQIAYKRAYKEIKYHVEN